LLEIDGLWRRLRTAPESVGQRIRIRVVDGVQQTGYILGENRHMQLPGLKRCTSNHHGRR
jgi:hypothetical protein